MSPRLVGCRQTRWWWWALWLAIGITIDPAHLRAQCAQEDPPSSSGTTVVEIEVRGTAASGTKSFAIIDGRLTFERRDTVCYELHASVHGGYGRSDGEVMANDWGVETSFDATPQGDFSPFAFGGLEQNAIRKLSLRARLGVGAKWMIMRKSNEDKTSLSAALLAAYEKHHRDVENPQPTNWRMSFRLKTAKVPATRADLRAVWFVQPRIDDCADYLVDGIVRLSWRLTERMQLTFTFDYFRDSDPPAEVQSSERRFLFGLAGRF